MIRFLSLFCCLCFATAFSVYDLKSFNHTENVDLDPLEKGLYVQALASLNCHVNQLMQADVQLDEPLCPLLVFADEDVVSLWEKAENHLYLDVLQESKRDEQALLEQAYRLYIISKTDLALGNHIKAQELLSETSDLLIQLWNLAVEEEFQESKSSREDNIEFVSVCRAKQVSNRLNNPSISSGVRKKLAPYLIKSNHPAKSTLDRLFATRVTLNETTLSNAGFHVLDRRERSFICVVSHPDLPDYLLKLHYDNDSRKKQHRTSWEWLVKRCEGAEKIQTIISRYKMKHFVCAKKWIYLLPEEPFPKHDKRYTRHLAVLLVTDMHLIPSRENYHAWGTIITKSHLDELYVIISRGKGSSYRPDNMPFTRDMKIAFIDTEYPNKGPDFHRIRHHLSPEMRQYWDTLVKNGGSS